MCFIPEVVDEVVDAFFSLRHPGLAVLQATHTSSVGLLGTKHSEQDQVPGVSRCLNNSLNDGCDDSVTTYKPANTYM